MQGVTLRHTDADLTREVNQAIQRFREWVSERGSPLYLTPHNAVLTIGPTSPYAWRELDLSALTPLMVRPYRVDVTIQGRVEQLQAVSFDERTEYQGATGPENGFPVAWIHYGYKIGILPPPDSAYAVTVWYLPLFTDISGSGTFDGIAGWEEWLRWEVLCRVVVRDDKPQLFQFAIDERKRLRDEIEAAIRREFPSVTTRKDRRGARRGRFARGFFP